MVVICRTKSIQGHLISLASTFDLQVENSTSPTLNLPVEQSTSLPSAYQQNPQSLQPLTVDHSTHPFNLLLHQLTFTATLVSNRTLHRIKPISNEKFILFYHYELNIFKPFLPLLERPNYFESCHSKDSETKYVFYDIRMVILLVKTHSS